MRSMVGLRVQESLRLSQESACGVQRGVDRYCRPGISHRKGLGRRAFTTLRRLLFLAILQYPVTLLYSPFLPYLVDNLSPTPTSHRVTRTKVDKMAPNDPAALTASDMIQARKNTYFSPSVLNDLLNAESRDPEMRRRVLDIVKKEPLFAKTDRCALLPRHTAFPTADASVAVLTSPASNAS